MIRFLVGGVFRILIWFFAFYLVMHLVRGIIHAIFPRTTQTPGPPTTPPPTGESGVGGRQVAPPARYTDVQDAKFSDLNDQK